MDHTLSSLLLMCLAILGPHYHFETPRNVFSKDTSTTPPPHFCPSILQTQVKLQCLQGGERGTPVPSLSWTILRVHNCQAFFFFFTEERKRKLILPTYMIRLRDFLLSRGGGRANVRERQRHSKHHEKGPGWRVGSSSCKESESKLEKLRLLMVLVKSGKGISKAITQISLKTNVQRKHVYICMYIYIFLHRLFFFCKKIQFLPSSLPPIPPPPTDQTPFAHWIWKFIHWPPQLQGGMGWCSKEKKFEDVQKRDVPSKRGGKKGKNSILAVCVCVCVCVSIHTHPHTPNLWDSRVKITECRCPI